MTEETTIDISKLSDSYEFSDTVILQDSSDKLINGDLSSLFHGRGNCEIVKYLLIDFNCQLENLSIVENFSNLESVQVYGNGTKSLNGLEKLTNLDNLFLDFKRGKDFDPNILSFLKLEFFEISKINRKEKDAIERGLKAKNIKIVGHDDSTVSYLKNTEVVRLVLVRGNFRHLVGIQDIPCTDLTLAYCQKLETIDSDQDIILENLTLETCNRLKLEELLDKIKCHQINIISCESAFSFQKLICVDGLKSIVLTNSGVIFNLDELNFDNTEVTNVFVAPIAADVFNQLQNMSSQVEWKN